MATRQQVADGVWITGASQTFRTPGGRNVRVWIEEADMLDKRNGQRYVGAARRVRCSHSAYGRAKTFLGESAWSDSERYACDIASKISPGVPAIFSF